VPTIHHQDTKNTKLGWFVSTATWSKPNIKDPHWRCQYLIDTLNVKRLFLKFHFTHQSTDIGNNCVEACPQRAMPSELTQNVKAAIHNFVSLQTSNGEVAIDVLRSIRDEAALLMERQTIWDTFDSDPLKFYDDDPQLRNQVERLKVRKSSLPWKILTFL
jgi:Fe-S-cluster-containing dehydrogenase component